MHSLVSLNGRILEPDKAKLSAPASGVLYGKGVFTTIAVRDSKPFLWNKHWRRLDRDARKVGVGIASLSESGLYEALDAIVLRNGAVDARARITILDASASRLWPFGTERKTDVLIQTADRRPSTGPFSITASPFPINSASPVAGVKSCNYIEHLIAIEGARSEGFDEALRANEKGEAASACMANVFWVQKGSDRLFTPSTRTGCLPGTTREFIIENMEVEEVEMQFEDMRRSATAVFLSSAGLGIIPAIGLSEQKGTHQGPKAVSDRLLSLF